MAAKQTVVVGRAITRGAEEDRSEGRRPCNNTFGGGWSFRREGKRGKRIVVEGENCRFAVAGRVLANGSHGLFAFEPTAWRGVRFYRHKLAGKSAFRRTCGVPRFLLFLLLLLLLILSSLPFSPLLGAAHLLHPVGRMIVCLHRENGKERTFSGRETESRDFWFIFASRWEKWMMMDGLERWVTFSFLFSLGKRYLTFFYFILSNIYNSSQRNRLTAPPPFPRKNKNIVSIRGAQPSNLTFNTHGSLASKKKRRKSKVDKRERGGWNFYNLWWSFFFFFFTFVPRTRPQ